MGRRMKVHIPRGAMLNGGRDLVLGRESRKRFFAGSDASVDSFHRTSNWITQALSAQGARVTNPYKQAAWFRAAAAANARAIAGVPFRIMQGTRGDEEKPGAVVDGQHPLARLFDRPHPAVLGSQLWEAASIGMDGTHGETILLKVGEDSRGVPQALAPLDPSTVTVVSSKMLEATEGVLAYEVMHRGQKYAFPPDRVIHLKNYNPDDIYRGCGPIQAAMRGIQVSSKVAGYNDGLLENGVRPSGILTFSEGGDPESVRGVADSFSEQHAGVSNAGKLAVLWGGAKWQDTTVTSQEAQFMEQMEWSREEVIALTGAPKLALGLIDDVNRANGRETVKHWWQGHLIPRLRLWESILWATFFEPLNESGTLGRGQQVWGEFDLSGVEALMEDFSEKITQGTALVAMGYTLDEVNERLGLGMPEVGDDLLEDDEQEEDTDPAEGSEPDTPVVDGSPTSGGEGEPADGGGDEGRAVAHGSRRVRFSARTREAAREAMRNYERRFLRPQEAATLRSARGFFRDVRDHLLGRLRDMAKPLEARDDEGPMEFRQTDVTEILGEPEDYGRMVTERMDPQLVKVVNSAIRQAAGDLGGLDLVDPKDPKWGEYHKDRIAQLVQVAKRYRKALRDSITEAINEGTQDVRGLSQVIRKTVANFSRHRADRIARTEVGMLGNGVRHDVFVEEGVQHHEWVSANDAVVRDSHQSVDGEVVAIGESFSNGLRRPHEQGAPAGEVVNCRCMVLPAIEDTDE